MTATRTAAESDGEGTSALVLAARHLARKLGNPMPALRRTVRAGERLLSIATALPDTAPDPYTALRRLLQAKTEPARAASRRERIATRPAPAQISARMRRAAPVREMQAAPARVREYEAAPLTRSPATPPGTQRGSNSAAAAVATSESRAQSPFAATSFTTNPKSAQLRADSTSNPVPRNDAASATSAQHSVASHDPLAQRRRRLRDGLQMRPTRTAPHEARSDVPTTALTALLGSVPLASARTHSPTTAAADHIDRAAPLDAATSQRPSVTVPTAAIGAERATTPTDGMVPRVLPPAARPSTNLQSRAARSTAANGSSVRRLLPPSSPLDTFGDVPANTLLDAAFRHGVEPT